MQPFGYTGYRYDTVADTYFAQAREYVPGVGRFAGEDWIKGSILSPIDLNQYIYCISNPIKYIDLDGQKYIIAWSYGQKEVKKFEKYINKKKNYSLNVDKSTSDWFDDIYSEWDARSSFSRAAHTKFQELVERGIPASNIVIERIDGVEDLKNDWNSWSKYNVVEGLYVYSHGYSEGPVVYCGGDIDFWKSTPKLNFSSNAEAIFYGCNTANGSFAQNFANSQNVVTYAQTDYASFSHDEIIRQRITDWDTSLGVYLHPYTWGFKLIKYENSFTTWYDSVFGEWNFSGQGKRFEPCETTD